jgi:para-nitrobenzyl esterase
MPEARPYFLPNLDGWVLKQMIGERIRDGSALTVPILAGYNADEGTLFYDVDLGKPTVLEPGPFPVTHMDRIARLQDIYGPEQAAALANLYQLNDATHWDRGATDMLGDDIFGVHMRYLASANAAKGLPTWLYFFSRIPASPDQTLGAFHASELAFVFDSHNAFLEANDADRALTEIMGTFWTNFAKTGNPNSADVPVWEPYTVEADNWLNLDHEIKTINGVRQAKLDIMTATLEEKLATSIAISKRVRPAPSLASSGNTPNAAPELANEELGTNTFEP